MAATAGGGASAGAGGDSPERDIVDEIIDSWRILNDGGGGGEHGGVSVSAAASAIAEDLFIPQVMRATGHPPPRALIEGMGLATSDSFSPPDTVDKGVLDDFVGILGRLVDSMQSATKLVALARESPGDALSTLGKIDEGAADPYGRFPTMRVSEVMRSATWSVGRLAAIGDTAARTLPALLDTFATLEVEIVAAMARRGEPASAWSPSDRAGVPVPGGTKTGVTIHTLVRVMEANERCLEWIVLSMAAHLGPPGSRGVRTTDSATETRVRNVQDAAVAFIHHSHELLAALRSGRSDAERRVDNSIREMRRVAESLGDDNRAWIENTFNEAERVLTVPALLEEAAYQLNPIGYAVHRWATGAPSDGRGIVEYGSTMAANFASLLGISGQLTFFAVRCLDAIVVAVPSCRRVRAGLRRDGPFWKDPHWWAQRIRTLAIAHFVTTLVYDAIARIGPATRRNEYVYHGRDLNARSMLATLLDGIGDWGASQAPPSARQAASFARGPVTWLYGLLAWYAGVEPGSWPVTGDGTAPTAALTRDLMLIDVGGDGRYALTEIALKTIASVVALALGYTIAVAWMARKHQRPRPRDPTSPPSRRAISIFNPSAASIAFGSSAALTASLATVWALNWWVELAGPWRDREISTARGESNEVALTTRNPFARPDLAGAVRAIPSYLRWMMEGFIREAQIAAMLAGRLASSLPGRDALAAMFTSTVKQAIGHSRPVLIGSQSFIPGRSAPMRRPDGSDIINGSDVIIDNDEYDRGVIMAHLLQDAPGATTLLPNGRVALLASDVDHIHSSMRAANVGMPAMLIAILLLVYALKRCIGRRAHKRSLNTRSATARSTLEFPEVPEVPASRTPPGGDGPTSGGGGGSLRRRGGGGAGAGAGAGGDASSRRKRAGSKGS